jgi:ABC-type amino acid transport substrate-binding protein
MEKQHEIRRSHLEDPGVDGRITLKRIFDKWFGKKDWIDLARN